MERKNPLIEKADAIIHGAIFGVAVEVAIKAAQAQLGFLALPIVSTIFRFFVEKLAGVIYSSLENLVAFSIIDAQVGAQKKEYDATVEALKASVRSGDEKAIAKAKEEYRAALRRLVHYDGE